MTISHTRAAIAAACAAALVAVTLAGCASSGSKQPIGGDIVAPVTMNVNGLQGAHVELVIGQVLNINTDSLAVDSYTAEISAPTVVEFVQGHTDDSAEFNPGLTGLAVGESNVVLTNEQGGIQPLEFTVRVSAKK